MSFLRYGRSIVRWDFRPGAGQYSAPPQPLTVSSRVEMWRGGVGLAYPFPALSYAGASLAKPCPVSTPRSSNRTCAINASGSRRKHHGFAHEKLRVRSVSRSRPNCS